VASLTCRRAVTGHDRSDLGETVHGFAGHELRAFSHRTGPVWIRAHDLRRTLDLGRSDGWMARARPTRWESEKSTLVDAASYRQHILKIEPEASFD